MRANDAIAGLVLIVLAAAMIVLTASFPEFPGQKYGPALFPRILGAGLIVCGAAADRGTALRRGAPARHGSRSRRGSREPWRLGSFLLMLALLLLYILAAETVGFIPLALLFLGAPVSVARRAAAGSPSSPRSSARCHHWFFATLLRVPLPRGWLNTIL